MRSVFPAFLCAITLSLCTQVDPSQLNKRWVAESVESQGGADPSFAEKIEKEAFLDLSRPLAFRARIPETDTMFAYHNRMIDARGLASIQRNETTDKLEVHLTYESPERLKGEEEYARLHNPSTDSIHVLFVMNEQSGDGRYRVTFRPATN